jgi:hypothetical protein
MSIQTTLGLRAISVLICAFGGASAYAADPFTDAMQEA